MIENNYKILLAHGSGGRLTHDLITGVFARHFENEYLSPLSDSALIDLDHNKIAFTTDSYVIKPLKFPGGDIGKLAVCGTVNDLAVAGATPLYLTCSFIIQEGLELSLLEEVVKSMAETAKEAGVKIVTGDTKVVENGAADGIFINTAGIGARSGKIEMGYDKIKPGDKIIINGNIGDHAMAVMAAREGLKLTSELKSDCAPLNNLISNTMNSELITPNSVHFMRDPTRGGLATILCEIVESTGFDIEIDETSLPISEEVRGISEVLGIDPLFSANEGKVILVVSENSAQNVLIELKKDLLGKNARIIGKIKPIHSSTGSKQTAGGQVTLKTEIGTHRKITMLTGDQLPRIC